MTTNKLDEIEGRHRVVDADMKNPDAGVSLRRMMTAHEDRAYLLSRVRELEAKSADQDHAYTTLLSDHEHLITERDRLRAILDAPVTEEMVTAATGALVYTGYNEQTQKRVIQSQAGSRAYVRGAIEAALAARRSK